MSKNNLPQPRVTHQSMTYQGPLPPAAEMAAFAQVGGDFPERIMRMAEQEQQHRFEMDREQMLLQKQAEERAMLIARANARSTAWGMVVTVLVILVVFAAVVICAYLGHPVPAAIFGAGGLAAIISAIWFGIRLRPQQHK